MLRHRGPDHTGFAVVGRTLLGHTRLAIVDPESGMQPTVARDPTTGARHGWAVNGEIYNHEALRASPDLAGAALETRCDCEVIGHLVERLGVLEACRRLDGVFAFVWAHEDGRWAVARDPVGVNPLYYARGPDGRLFFASELKAFEQLGDPEVLAPRLFPPGHVWWEGAAGDSPVPFYNFEAWEAPPLHAAEPARLAELLEAAVVKRLMSDREVGVFLSGGLDSSLVAGLVAKHQRARGVAVKSFSIGLEGAPDLEHARAVAAHLGTDHHEVHFTLEEGLRALPDVVRAIETVDTTSIRASTPMWLLSKYVRENTNVKVLYSGEGADEMLCGYLYFHNSPTPEEGRLESARRVRELHQYDCQRANKSTSNWGLEVRVPFLDLDLLHYVMRADGASKLPVRGVEKHVLREAFAGTGLIPDTVLRRQKEQFSDGVGFSWVDALRTTAAREPDTARESAAIEAAFGRRPTGPEQRRVMRLFAEAFNAQACASVGGETATWRPCWNEDPDPSGRAVSAHHQTWASRDK